MVFNATLNNISLILWWSVLLVEEIGVPGENERFVYTRFQKNVHKGEFYILNMPFFL